MPTSTESLQSTRRPLPLASPADVRVSVASRAAANAPVLGVPLFTTSDPFPVLGLTNEQLLAAGFTAEPGSALVIPRAGQAVLVAVGLGQPSSLDADHIRDAAAAFAASACAHGRLTFSLTGFERIATAAAASAAVEGILLARYRFAGFGRPEKEKPVEEITLIVGSGQEAEARAGAELGRAYSRATILARDLANTPHSHLSATDLAQIARELGEKQGFGVEVLGKPELQQLRFGGILGVNAGSVEPPCMIKLTYRPAGKATGRLALVGKGVMYDSGGISLKPNDNVHARMKNDMSGAAAVLAAIAELPELQCPTMVTGYLMCTDNMPSGTAQALGDVITTHSGRTVEVNNTDAEGRLVMCDALSLAVEEQHDAIIDIATLTGSVMRALGPDIAGLFGNDPALIEQVKRSAATTGEPVWQLPLHKPYRKALDSDVATMRNTGSTGAAQPDGIVAALYLSEFVGNAPWAHVDICGTAWNETDRLWHRAGCSGFGARLLVDIAMQFRGGATAPQTHH